MNAPRSREPKSLQEEIVINETGPCRAVEICVEDHPKMVTPTSLIYNRSLGITAMEMGIQTTDDKVHQLTKRDSTRAQLINRAELCKNFGFKVLAHIMPDLPGSSPELDKKVIDDILNGTDDVRVSDHRQAIGAVGAVAIAVAFYVAAKMFGNNFKYGLVGALVMLLLFVVIMNFVEKRSIRHYYLFDYDRYYTVYHLG